MTADPGRSVSSVDVLDEREHARLGDVGNWAALTQPAPPPVSIPVLFAEQVARSPEAAALTSGEQSWTYRQVDEAANRLAHLLAAHGVRPAGAWRCWRNAPPGRSYRFWRCSRPGRSICRSTRHTRRRASGSCSMTLRRRRLSPRVTWPTG
ncbi:linear gramicidin synthetase subunit D domain protein [Mycobacterium xenopi 3993]|nr:linear gramicidin synthetase subunit D domain protein [Mycobacterium xenopi 3993]